MVSNPPVLHPVTVCSHRWLCAHTFEIRFQWPAEITFFPGQMMQQVHEGIKRDHWLLTTADSDELAICVRHLPEGRMSPVPENARISRTFHLTPAAKSFIACLSGMPFPIPGGPARLPIA